MTDPIAVPLTFGDAGPVATAPATLRSLIEQAVANVQPGYTADLPGTLIEDVLSTEMGAVVTIDQARAEAVVNATPYLAAPYVLAQLGAQAGIAQGTEQNTSVLVVFSGPVGFILPAGTQVSDGTYTYVLQSATIIGSSGASLPALCVAQINGNFFPAAGAVTTILTALSQSVTCTNPSVGTAGIAAESPESYRARVLQAGLAEAQGFTALIKTALRAIPGVQSRLVAVKQNGVTWQIICGGAADPYQIANAIMNSTINFAIFQGATNSDLDINVSVIDGVDTYNVTYIAPAAQTTQITLNWNTTTAAFTDSQQFNTLAQAAILNYVNSIPVGQPINLKEMEYQVQQATASVLPNTLLTSMAWSVVVNGTTVSPEAGTSIILSPGTSYFIAALGDITVQQG